MRTIGEIIEAAKLCRPVTREELYAAMLAVELVASKAAEVLGAQSCWIGLDFIAPGGVKRPLSYEALLATDVAYLNRIRPKPPIGPRQFYNEHLGVPWQPTHIGLEGSQDAIPN